MHRDLNVVVTYCFPDHDLLTREVRCIDLKADEELAAHRLVFISRRHEDHFFCIIADVPFAFRTYDLRRHGLCVFKAAGSLFPDLHFPADLILLSGDQILIGHLVNDHPVLCGKGVLLFSFFVKSIRLDAGEAYRLPLVTKILMVADEGSTDVQLLEDNKVLVLKACRVEPEGNFGLSVRLLRRKGLLGPHLAPPDHEGLPGGLHHKQALKGVFPARDKVLIGNGIFDLRIFRGHQDTVLRPRVHSACTDLREMDSLRLIIDLCMSRDFPVFKLDRLKGHYGPSGKRAVRIEDKEHLDGAVDRRCRELRLCSDFLPFGILYRLTRLLINELSFEHVLVADDEVLIGYSVLDRHFPAGIGRLRARRLIDRCCPDLRGRRRIRDLKAVRRCPLSLDVDKDRVRSGIVEPYLPDIHVGSAKAAVIDIAVGGFGLLDRDRTKRHCDDLAIHVERIAAHQVVTVDRGPEKAVTRPERLDHPCPGRL